MPSTKLTFVDDLTWRRIIWATKDMRPFRDRRDLEHSALERAERMVCEPSPNHVSALSYTVNKSFWRHILWAKRQAGHSTFVSYQGHVLWSKLDAALDRAANAQHTPFFPGGYE